MNKPILFVIVFLLVFIACSENEKHARIIIELENIEDDYLLLSLAPIGNEPKFIFDTIPVISGKTTFDTFIYEPHKGQLIANGMFKFLENGEPFLIRSKVIEFFIDQSQTIIIKGEIKEYSSEYEVAGSLLNVQFTDFNKIRSCVREKHSRAMYLYENCFSEETYNPDQALLLEQKMADLYPQILQNEIDYILNNRDSELSAYLLSKQKIDTIMKYYDILSATALETNYGKLLESKVTGFNILTEGDLAPVFVHKTLQDEEFRLNDYFGLPIVLYFWGTWCAPCIGEIPRLKEFYLENSEKLKFVGIACRDNTESLTGFIKQHNIRWTQLLNIENSDNDLSKMYGVRGYPTKILLNKEGLIYGKFHGATEEFYTRVDKLMNE